jgi:hypothetical protein
MGASAYPDAPSATQTPEGKRHGRPASVSAHSEAIKEMLAQGVSKREIARRLVISRTSVRRMDGCFTALIACKLQAVLRAQPKVLE